MNDMKKSIFDASEEEKQIERDYYAMLNEFHEICKPEIQWGGVRVSER